MKKIRILLLCLIGFIPSAYASGFTWISHISEAWNIPEHVLTFFFVASLLIGIGLLYRAQLSKCKNALVPDEGITVRNLIEAYGEFIYNQCKNVIGEDRAPKYFSFCATLFLLILINNLIGLIPGFLPATEQLDTTLALGIIAFVYYNIVGMKEVGVINYIKHFAGPLWYMAVIIFPIEIVSNFIRPISLALRLRGNMYGDHIVLSVFTEHIIPYVIPIPFLLLGTLVCVIQAYVFTILTMVYISLATAHHDHEEEVAH